MLSSATYNTVTGGQVTQPSVTLVTSSAAGARSEYLIGFATSSPDGGLTSQEVGKITVAFLTGTDITTVSGNTFVRDVTAGNVFIESSSTYSYTLSLHDALPISIPAGHQVSVELDGVINP